MTKNEKNAAIMSAHLFMKKLDRAYTKTKENTTTIETDSPARLKFMQRADRNRPQNCAMTLVVIAPFHLFRPRPCGGEHSFCARSPSCFEDALSRSRWEVGLVLSCLPINFLYP